MNAAQKAFTGGCLCGGVRYRVSGELRGVTNCFCEQCRKSSGHHVAAAHARHADFHLENDHTLKWYRSSEKARRGFCRECGGNLFWQPDHGNTVSIMAGTLDTPTGLSTIGNVYVDDASDYQIVPKIK